MGINYPETARCKTYLAGHLFRCAEAPARVLDKALWASLLSMAFFVGRRFKLNARREDSRKGPEFQVNLLQRLSSHVISTIVVASVCL